MRQLVAYYMIDKSDELLQLLDKNCVASLRLDKKVQGRIALVNAFAKGIYFEYHAPLAQCTCNIEVECVCYVSLIYISVLSYNTNHVQIQNDL